MKYIFNYDESSSRLINPPKTAIRVKGSDNVKIECEQNTKAGTTTGLIISESGSFLKPFIIGKGKTDRCLNKYNLTRDVIGTYTKKGWIDHESMKKIIDMIAIHTKKHKSLLILDKYGVHTDKKIVQYAKNNNIELLFVPTGLTYKYQPLDTTINGIIKAKMTKRYSEFIAKNPDGKYTHSKWLEDLLKSKKEIKKSVIIHSFDCLNKCKSNNE